MLGLLKHEAEGFATVLADPPVWFDLKAMNAGPPQSATASKFSRDAYALSAPTSPISTIPLGSLHQ